MSDVYFLYAQVDNEERPPRLFQCSNASGVFTVNEISEFTQVYAYIIETIIPHTD